MIFFESLAVRSILRWSNELILASISRLLVGVVLSAST